MAKATHPTKMIFDALHASTNFPFMHFLEFFFPLSSLTGYSIWLPIAFPFFLLSCPRVNLPVLDPCSPWVVWIVAQSAPSSPLLIYILVNGLSKNFIAGQIQFLIFRCPYHTTFGLNPITDLHDLIPTFLLSRHGRFVDSVTNIC